MFPDVKNIWKNNIATNIIFFFMRLLLFMRRTLELACKNYSKAAKNERRHFDTLLAQGNFNNFDEKIPPKLP
jgi:hypothetical protein